MNNFDWTEFKKDSITVHCNTEEKAKDFLKHCYNLGFIWAYENLLNDNHWCAYKKDTCYECYNNGLDFCSLDYYKEENYKIIEWEIKDMDKYELHIASDGITTNCVYKLNGKVINKSNAKLNPIYKFNFEEEIKNSINKIFKNNIIKKGTKFKVLNIKDDNNINNMKDFVCLDAYIGQIGTFNYNCDLNNYEGLLASGTFEKEYINAIDNENGNIIWLQSEVEILKD